MGYILLYIDMESFAKVGDDPSVRLRRPSQGCRICLQFCAQNKISAGFIMYPFRQRRELYV
jgi:hypothetical protein